MIDFYTYYIFKHVLLIFALSGSSYTKAFLFAKF